MFMGCECMEKNYRVTTFVMDSGERYCMVVDRASGLPMYYPTLFLTTQIRNREDAFSTMLAAATVLINYRSMLSPATEWYLATIRGFLRSWHELGYPGISKEVNRLLDGWTLKGNRKGDAVKRMDPQEGPLTDNELTAFNEGAVRAYEKNLITIAELATVCMITP